MHRKNRRRVQIVVEELDAMQRMDRQNHTAMFLRFLRKVLETEPEEEEVSDVA